MADESLLPGNLDQSSTPDAPKPDENQGCITQSDPLSSCIINLRKSIFPPISPEQAAGFMTDSDPLSSRILELKKSIFPPMPPEQAAAYRTESDPLSS